MRIENKDHLSVLTFFNVSEKDYGNYTCVASNKLGNSNASVILYGKDTIQWGSPTPQQDVLIAQHVYTAACERRRVCSETMGNVVQRIEQSVPLTSPHFAAVTQYSPGWILVPSRFAQSHVAQQLGHILRKLLYYAL